MHGSDTARFLARLEEYLAQSLPPANESHPRLHDAMAHSLLGKGKRLRPQLLWSAALLGEAREDSILRAAAALEMLHSYSLIHDDLPAMDDDDWRRGQPTCHKVYGEAMAILAGDALQALAFDTLTRALWKADLAPQSILFIQEEFADAAGPRGLVAGQAADLEPPAGNIAEEQVRWIHERKTGRLIRSALTMGARLARLPEEEIASLRDAGSLLGLAFQATDDLLDGSATRHELGKTPGKDRRQGKVTYLSLLGPESTQRLAESYLAEALDLIPARPEAETLRALASRLVNRRS